MTIIVPSSSVAGTVSTLRTAIQQRGYASDTATAQTELLNSVYRRLSGMRRWPWLETGTAGLVTIVGQSAYNLLSTVPDFLHVDAVRLEIGTEYYDLEYEREQDFRSLQHTDRTNGIPSLWTLRGRADLNLHPRPDRVYTVTVDYLKDPPDLLSDSDQPLVPATYQDILVWGAIVELAYRERDWQGVQVADANYGQRLLDMMLEYGLTQRQTSTQVVQSGTYDHLDERTWRQWGI